MYFILIFLSIGKICFYNILSKIYWYVSACFLDISFHTYARNNHPTLNYNNYSTINDTNNPKNYQNDIYSTGDHWVSFIYVFYAFAFSSYDTVSEFDEKFRQFAESTTV